MGTPVAFIPAPAGRAEKPAAERHAPEYFSALPLAAVALFALNNAVLKRAWPGLITGKLSDVLACFFMPLFISALLERVFRLAVATRMAIGVALTATIFIAVKTSAIASGMLNRDIALLLAPVGIRTAPNRVDPSDLCALPMLAVAWLYARRKVAR
jgi:hypothetical protein